MTELYVKGQIKRSSDTRNSVAFAFHVEASHHALLDVDGDRLLHLEQQILPGAVQLCRKRDTGANLLALHHRLGVYALGLDQDYVICFIRIESCTQHSPVRRGL